ncbi:LysR family transcriptional regulator [Alteromonas oceanisediminis]|uniref:LysR family transcriptional regulator n=1 Tax=Alteromonas oceanisediminis TaxID=2836180 RepID=UPI001BDA732D|nr:LysR family transcriptional regulator [Alteromonas oceanisediminis]MBT0587671.1 LysR family transcriptional regulator [Alteromonas oceanisediminis]
MAYPISLEALKVIATIQQKGSFAAAAEALFKVPSALTYTVSKLEQELGVTVFDRSGHRAKLTAAGHLVLSEGQQLLDAAQRLTEKVKELESGWEPRLTIAVDTVLPCQPVLQTVARFCELQKPVNIQLLEEVLGGGWDALTTQRADLAVGLSGETAIGNYDVKPIANAEFVFAVAATHSLASAQEPIASDHVSQYPAIVVKDSSRTLPDRSSGLFAARQTVHVTSMAHKIAAQVSGVGVGFLPLHMIRQHLANGELVIKFTDIPRPPIPLYIAKRKDTQGKAAQWFYQQLSDVSWFTT